mmetsp:Transcript_109172/g.213908  ORF Transcript_109172/g.213908 Transcript_109172/m.213908 type:complete len:208 (-) Transcript_109172:342-965(-)
MALRALRQLECELFWLEKPTPLHAVDDDLRWAVRWRTDLDVALGADDGDVLRRVGLKGEHEAGAALAGPGEREQAVLVATGGRQLARTSDCVRYCAAEHHGGSLHDIATDLKHAAASLLRVPQAAALLCGRFKAEVSLDIFRLANLAGGEHLASFPDGREEARPHSLHQEKALRPREVHQLPHLRFVDGHGLLADDVLPSLERQLYE